MEYDVNFNISKEINYKVNISNKPFNKFFDEISEFIQNKKALIIVSKKVYKLYKQHINIKNSHIFVLKDGEQEKNYKNYLKIIKSAIENNFERGDFFIALGGGVVGDLTGFAASTYMRGINFIQIPTTLLSAVDAAYGGKTALNTKFGKNLIGSFYHPKKVFCNINFFKTLDERQYKTGLAEILKYAFIEESSLCDENYNLYELLLSEREKIIDRDDEILANIVRISVEMKKSIVTKDEKESGLRKILNFGHTFGHAYELLSSYKKYTHGEAVAAGMIKAFQTAEKLKFADEHFTNSAIYFIESFNIIEKMPTFSKSSVINSIKKDKKIRDGKIDFIIPTHIKNVEIKQLDLSSL